MKWPVFSSLFPRTPRWWGYLIAIILTLTASVIPFRLSVAHPTPRVILLAAVALSTWVGGERPGLLAVALSVPAIIADLTQNARPDIPTIIVVLILFLGVSLTIVWTLSSLKRVETRLHRILNSITDIFFAVDAHGKFLDFNVRAEDFFHQPISKLRGKVLWEEFPPAKDSTFVERFQEIVTEQKSMYFEMPSKINPGSWLEFHVYPTENRVDVYLRDITERKQSEIAMKEAQATLLSFYRSAPIILGVVETSQDNILHIMDSDRTAQLFGIKLEDIQGHWANELGTPPDAVQTMLAHYSESERTGKPVKFEFCFPWLGKGRCFDVAVSFIGKSSNGRSRFSYAAEDITDRKNAETTLQAVNQNLDIEVTRAKEVLQNQQRELEMTRRLEAVGRLAGGVAHDFNNLLTGIVGIVQEARGHMPANEPFREDLDMAIKAAQSAFSLTRQLLAFSRHQTAAPKVVDMNANLFEIQKMLPRLIGEDIHLHIDLKPDGGNVKIDPSQLSQIIVNLVLNARDAMPNGGDLWIDTAEHVVREGAEVSIPQGRYVRLTVRDTGIGMSQAIMDRMFEPFFTTKGGKGTGLGLSTVYGIVKQNDGHILIRSHEGQGTTVEVYLPHMGTGCPDDLRLNARDGTVGGRETVLVTEDEEIVRRVTSRMLQREGYHVLEAENGKQALDMAEHCREPINLLLTDVVMPEMNGRQLAEQLRKNHPETKVLYMSGYARDILDMKGVISGETQFIEKTAISNYLRRKVREVLDQPRPV